MCRSMPYNTTKFPNHMGHLTATEAYSDLSQFWPLIKSKCSFQLKPFLCSMYFPKCTAYGESLLPCRSLCYKGKRGCLDVLTAFKMEWPEQFDCRHLPDTNCYNVKDKTPKSKYNKCVQIKCKTDLYYRQVCILTAPILWSKLRSKLGFYILFNSHGHIGTDSQH